MTLAPPKFAYSAWRLLPMSWRRKLRSTPAKRLFRFAPAAVLALCASQITYLIFSALNMTAGITGAAGWFAGAAVSYIVSRWAWERKGRPSLLKETLPFWGISICVGVVLTLASKLGNHEAQVLGLHGIENQAFKQAFFLAANCLTFATRFLIFHYVLFTDRSLREQPVPGGSGMGDAEGDPQPLAFARPSAPVRGPAHHSHRR
jgi:putative flippase GtrA